jgi:hypothetical protein
MDQYYAYKWKRPVLAVYLVPGLPINRRGLIRLERILKSYRIVDQS